MSPILIPYPSESVDVSNAPQWFKWATVGLYGFSVFILWLFMGIFWACVAEVKGWRFVAVVIFWPLILAYFFLRDRMRKLTDAVIAASHEKPQ